MESLEIKGIERIEKRKDVKRVRAQGYVPGVVYGNEQSLLVSLPANDLDKLIKHGGNHSIISLDLEGAKKKQNVVLKAVQRNPKKGNIVHVDFLLINLNQEIEQTVPIAVIGEEDSPGLRAGGLIQTISRDVAIKGKAKDLPDHITVDISETEIGTQIKVADLKAPSGIEIISNPEEGILAIVLPAKPKEEEIAEEAPAPGEVPRAGEAEQEESGS